MQKILAAMAFMFIFAAGCVQQQGQTPGGGNQCAQVITYAVSQGGVCMEFPTPCDVPAGYNVVQNCETNEPPQADLCAGVACDDRCVGSTYFSNGTCSAGNCIYANQADNAPACAAPGRFSFDANLLFCDYDGVVKKYLMFYQIRNRTDNLPTYRSTIWLKAPELGYGNVKTIQRDYAKNRIMWEDQRHTFVDRSYNGQFWEIRNLDYNRPLDYQLIYCEPEFSTQELCTPQNGVLIDSGNTADVCT